jgi:hypothetical protein
MEDSAQNYFIFRNAELLKKFIPLKKSRTKFGDIAKMRNLLGIF